MALPYMDNVITYRGFAGSCVSYPEYDPDTRLVRADYLRGMLLNWRVSK